MPSTSTSRFFFGKSPAVSHKEKWPLGTLAFFHVWKSPSLLRIQFWHPGVSRKFQIHSPPKQLSVLTVNLSFILKYQNFNWEEVWRRGVFFYLWFQRKNENGNPAFLWFSSSFAHQMYAPQFWFIRSLWPVGPPNDILDAKICYCLFF